MICQPETLALQLEQFLKEPVTATGPDKTKYTLPRNEMYPRERTMSFRRVIAQLRAECNCGQEGRQAGTEHDGEDSESSPNGPDRS
jgi:hypothetical protein